MTAQSSWNGSNTTDPATRTGIVGIGTSSPQTRLHISTPSGTQGYDPLFMRFSYYSNASSRETGYHDWTFSANGSYFKLDYTHPVDPLSNRLTILAPSGFVGIGTTSPVEKLHVADGGIVVSENGDIQFKVSSDGNVRAREVQVDLATIPDYVFEPGYNLMPLGELRGFVSRNHHLPGVPSAADFERQGYIGLQQLNLKLLEKVEELTLYTLELEQRLQALEAPSSKH